VANVPDYGTEEVADSAISFMLALRRGTAKINADVPGGAGDQGYAVFPINFHRCESRGQG
jgi:D-3-phosphoglycerate dehydrogenase/C-terminal binding protein